MKGLQHWTAYPPPHAAPATPEDHPDHFRCTCLNASAFPLRPQGRHLHLHFRGYIWVHLRYGLLLCQLGTYDPLLPRRRSLELPGRIGQLPGRDFNPLDSQLLLHTVASTFYILHFV